MTFIRWSLFLLLLCVVYVFTAKTLFRLPDENFETATSAPAPYWEGTLGRAAAEPVSRNAGLDGVHPLGNGQVAFAARAVLARAAEKSIDAQYYIWQNDTTGLMLLEELRAAAERGVSVRLLVDDNGIPGMDDLMAELDAMETAEVRIFNPFPLRSPKLLSYTFNFSRLNRRMHNKSMTVDGVATIIGGRNIGDIYFGYGEGTHYFDVDVVAVGPIVQDVSSSFDAYWNSASSYDADRILAPAGAPTLKARADAARSTAIGVGYQESIKENAIVERLVARDLALEWANVRLIVDDPSKGLGQAEGEELMIEHLFDLAKEAKTSIDLVSAYFIPGPRGMELLTEVAQSGVGIRVLTNSLDATDVMPVHAAYAPYRKAMLESGIELHELKSLRKERPARSLPEVLAGSASGLHAKVFGFDGTRVLIGSFNLDPRSSHLNTEMGLLIESPTIADALDAEMRRSELAYQVQLQNGALVWIEEKENGDSVVYSRDPETGFGKRLLAKLVSWLPIEWML